MYTEKHVIPLLIKACPDWAATLETTPTDGKGGAFLAMSALARYIIHSFRNESVDEFPKLFATVELILREGGDKAKELMGAGLIEALQRFSAKESMDPCLLKPWLKEETQKAWNDIERFWNKRTPPDVAEAEVIDADRPHDGGGLS